MRSILGMNWWLFLGLSAALYGCSSDASSNPESDTAVATGDTAPDNGAITDGAPSTDGAMDANQSGSCNPRDSVLPEENFFTDISDSSGIRLNNHYPGQAQPINDHSRLGFADLNGDGLDDIVMHSLFPNPQSGIPFEHLVFVHFGIYASAIDSRGLVHAETDHFPGDIIIALVFKSYCAPFNGIKNLGGMK